MTCTIVVIAVSLLVLLQTAICIEQDCSFGDVCHMHEKMSSSRVVTKSLLSKWQDEGVGARVRRSIGRQEVIVSFRNLLEESLLLIFFSEKGGCVLKPPEQLN